MLGYWTGRVSSGPERAGVRWWYTGAMCSVGYLIPAPHGAVLAVHHLIRATASTSEGRIPRLVVPMGYYGLSSHVSKLTAHWPARRAPSLDLDRGRQQRGMHFDVGRVLLPDLPAKHTADAPTDYCARYGMLLFASTSTSTPARLLHPTRWSERAVLRSLTSAVRRATACLPALIGAEETVATSDARASVQAPPSHEDLCGRVAAGPSPLLSKRLENLCTLKATASSQHPASPDNDSLASRRLQVCCRCRADPVARE